MGLISRVKNWIAPQQQSSGEFQQSGLTVAQLKEYAATTGDLDVFNFYGVGGYGFRNQAVTFAVFYRVVTLLSSVMAQLITCGNLRIINPRGEIDKSRMAQNILGLLQHSPDGVTPAFQFIEDAALDYLIDGNALLAVQRAMGRLALLKRLESSTALLDYDHEYNAIYRAYDAYDYQRERYNLYSDLDVIHARWGLVTKVYGASGNRARFASAPVALMRPAVSIGLESDRYILDWYKTDSPKANVGISIQKSLTAEQKEQFYTQFQRAAKTRAPLLMGEGASFTNLNNTSSGSSTQATQRDFQVSEICRIYGVPGPVVNQQVTQWGSGIEQLSKMLYRFGLRQHLERLLSPMKMKLLPRGYQFSLDETDLLRGDTAGISALLNSTRGDSQRKEVATIEEQRRWAGLPVTPEYGELEPLMMAGGSDNNNNGDMNGDADNDDDEQ